MSQTNTFVKYNKKDMKYQHQFSKLSDSKDIKVLNTLDFCPLQTDDKLFVGWHQSTGWTLKSGGQKHATEL